MLRFFISNKKESFFFDHSQGPLEFGRKVESARSSGDGILRRDLKDDYASADHLRVEEMPRGKVRLDNLSKRIPIQLADGSTIEVGGSCEVGLPARMTVGLTLIEIRSESEEEKFGASPLMTVALPVSIAGPNRAPGLDPLPGAPDTGQLTRWFEAVLSVQRAAACSTEFYQEIARAVVELIGLDYGLVLLRKDDREQWQVAGRHETAGVPGSDFSRTILGCVCRERRTFYQTSLSAGVAESLSGVSFVIASPVLDADGESVVGAVYGVKGGGTAVGPNPEIGLLYAQLVQVLAAAAGAGLARRSSETEAARRYVQFEQFVGGGLAGELDRDPGLLEGRDCEVTVLVSDIRGFSRIAERLGPRETCDLIGDVLDRLTAKIHEHGGIVVDYVGDGILAMWNAPVDQPDHAARACRAALAMIGELPGLDERWAGRIGSSLALGVGVNTGLALVGNTGSRQRLKYGPLGNTVNLASRVEGATKQLGVPVLITGDTYARLVEPFATRRLCKVRVVGISAPVDLYELHGETASDSWLAGRTAYEGALVQFETGNLSEACRSLFPLLDAAGGRHDTPSLTLAARAIENLRTASRGYDPVLTLESK